MTYTQGEVRAFVMDATIRGPVRPPRLIEEGVHFQILVPDLVAAATELREAGWIEYASPYYRATVRGLIQRGNLPDFLPIQPVNLASWIDAIEGPTIPDACTAEQLRVLHSRICEGSHD